MASLDDKCWIFLLRRVLLVFLGKKVALQEFHRMVEHGFLYLDDFDGKYNLSDGKFNILIYCTNEDLDGDETQVPINWT